MKLLNDFGFPVYVNPTFNELLELCSTGWDTLRICTDDTSFCVGSGYGNTHHNIIQVYKELLGIKRWHPKTYILYHFNGELFFNLEDVSGDCRVPLMVARHQFNSGHWEYIDEIAKAFQ